MAKIAAAILTAASALTAADKDGSITNTSTADLLAFYNAHVERFGTAPANVQVAEFKDRQTTLIRAVKLAEAILAAADAPPAAKPKADPVTAEERSANIAATWADPAVRAARAARHPVIVAGVPYASVAKAFTALGLPMNKHVAFRAKLAAAGEGDFEHDGKVHSFTVGAPPAEAKTSAGQQAAHLAQDAAAAAPAKKVAAKKVAAKKAA